MDDIGTGISFNLREERDLDIWFNIDKLKGHCTKGNKVKHKASHDCTYKHIYIYRMEKDLIIEKNNVF